jgi:hypothetical protein
MDFVHDPLATGRNLRMLTTVDIFSRFSPALAPRFTVRSIASQTQSTIGQNPLRQHASQWQFRLFRRIESMPSARVRDDACRGEHQLMFR